MRTEYTPVVGQWIRLAVLDLVHRSCHDLVITTVTVHTIQMGASGSLGEHTCAMASRKHNARLPCGTFTMSALVCQLLCVLLRHVVDGVDLRLRMPLPDGARVSADSINTTSKKRTTSPPTSTVDADNRY